MAVLDARSVEQMVTKARLSREEGVDELSARWGVGEHVTLLGPTGRGKSTLMSQVLPKLVHDRIVICCPKGADPAYSELGHPTMVWPPKRPWQDQLKAVVGQQEDRHASGEGPQVWRIEVPVRKLEDFSTLAGIYHRVLGDAMARREGRRDSVVILLDDSRLISDAKHMNLGPLVTANLMIGRSKGVSIVNNYQAPRWIPREGLDQVTHLLLWRNRDRDVVDRLAEIGDLDGDVIREILGRLSFHECLWIDCRADELFVIGQ